MAALNKPKWTMKWTTSNREYKVHRYISQYADIDRCIKSWYEGWRKPRSWKHYRETQYRCKRA